LWSGSMTWNRTAGRRYLGLLGVPVLASAPMAAAGAPLGLGAVGAWVGRVRAALEGPAQGLAAERAPPGTLTESGTWLNTAINVSSAAGLAAAGALVDRAGVPATPAVACACPAAG